MKKQLFAIWFTVLFAQFLSAQNESEEQYDTARRIDPRYANEDFFLRNRDFNSGTDSSMLFLQQYDQTQKEHKAIQNLGDVHTPFKPLIFSHPAVLGFRLGAEPFKNLYFLSDSVRFYNTYQPCSEFSYAQGGGGQRGMIDFDAFHTQNYGERFNFTVKYHSTSNDGFYLRQTMSLKNLIFSSHYSNRSKVYTAAFVLTWNKTNFMESAGILQDAATDSLFKSLPVNVRLVDVSLNGASNINRQREYRIQQIYRFKNKTDSGIGNLSVSHVFSAVREANYYRDVAADFGLYDSVYYYNSLFSSDSVNMRRYSNRFELFTPYRDKGISFRAGIAIDNFIVFQSANEGNFIEQAGHNTYLYGSLNLLAGQYFKPDISGHYYISGYNKNNYNLRILNEFSPFKRKLWHISGMLQSSLNNADYLLYRRRSNHYKWDNNFEHIGGTTINSLKIGVWKKTDTRGLKNAFRYTLPGKSFELFALYSDISNQYYINSDMQVSAGAKHQGLFQANASMHFNFRQIQFHQDLVWQKLSEDLKISMQLPEFISRSSIYYQNYAFKKATFVQIGIDAVITSSYRAGFYNPALQSFTSGITNVGAYPVLDAFISAEVKTARIFFKMEHFNQDMFPAANFPNYMFASPYQPMAARRFRLGFNWKFYY